MKARRTGCIAVPEIDRKCAVRKIEKNESLRNRDALELAQKRHPLLVAIAPQPNAVARDRVLFDADVFDHAGTDHHVEVAVREGQTRTTRDHKPLFELSLAPLPLAKLRNIVAPSLKSQVVQPIDRESIAAAAIENATRRGRKLSDQWSVEVGNSANGTFDFQLESFEMRRAQCIGRIEGVEVMALREVGDAVLDRIGNVARW